MNAERVVAELENAVSTHDHATVAERVERHWPYVVRIRPSLLDTAIARLPQEHTRPTHHLVRDLLHPDSWRAPAVQDRLVAETLQAMPVPAADAELVASTGAAVLHALRRRGRFADALELGTELVVPASTLQGTDLSSLAAGLYLQVGNLHLLQGDLRHAERWLETAFRQPSAFTNHAADAAGRLALLCALRGETARAEGWLERAAAADAGASPWPLRAAERVPQLCARALLALDRLDWSAYHEHDDRIDAERIEQDEQWMYVLHHRALASVLRGNQRAVAEEIADYRGSHPQYLLEPSLPSGLLESAEAALMVSLGQLPEVRERLTAWGGDRVHLAASTHLLLACGRADEAAALSDPLRWPPRTTRREQILLLLAQCGARHHLGQVGAAAAALRRAVNLTGHRGLAWLYAFACVDRPILTDLVRKVPEAAPIVVRLEELAPTDPTSQPAELQLTPREMLVLQQLARGLNIQQISEQLYVSPSTVKNQRKSIYRKLGASSRDEALAAAARRGLLVQTV